MTAVVLEHFLVCLVCHFTDYITLQFGFYLVAASLHSVIVTSLQVLHHLVAVSFHRVITVSPHWLHHFAVWLPHHFTVCYVTSVAASFHNLVATSGSTSFAPWTFSPQTLAPGG